jgi:hypothetical protein
MEKDTKDSIEANISGPPSLYVPVASYTERRSLPRLCLASEQFRLNSHDRLFSVSDLSENGLGLDLIDPQDLKYFVIGAHLKGLLNLRRAKLEVTLKVCNLFDDRVGCEFYALEAAAKTTLLEFLDPSALGAALKPMPLGEFFSLWYHGPSRTDLMFRRLSDGRFRKLSLYVLGVFVQWDEQEGLVTGTTQPALSKNEVRGILRIETLWIYLDALADSAKLSIAKKVILSSNLPKDLKHWSLRQLAV